MAAGFEGTTLDMKKVTIDAPTTTNSAKARRLDTYANLLITCSVVAEPPLRGYCLVARGSFPVHGLTARSKTQRITPSS